MISSIINKYAIGFVALLLVLWAGCRSAQPAAQAPEANDPSVIAVFDDEVLTLNEFERQYARSSGASEAAAEDSLSEYREFLERYVNFRLKVRAAKDAGVSESAEVQNEIRTYRASLARPYLLEQEVLEPIVRTLYDRQQQIVDVSHLLLRIDPGTAPEDTLEAYRRIAALRDSALQGIDFGELALRHSEDPSARRNPNAPGYRGRLGYFSAGRLVEPFETYAYETEPGEISKVFRTRFGYHILKVHDRREAEPGRQLSHIMIRPQPTAEDSAAALELIRRLKQQLEEGADFAELAKQHSHDMQTRGRGGEIGMVTYDAPIHESFKDPAFALDEVGEVSDVVETPYGFHLIELTGIQEEKSYEESYDELKQLASRLPRTSAAEERLARDVLENRGARIDTSAVVGALEGIPADSVFTRLMDKRLPESALADTFFVIGDSSYTVRDLADNTTQTAANQAGDAERLALAILSDYVTRTAIDFEAARLEERDQDFGRLMEEFRDGLVLFQFMEDSVWTAAESDSAALRAHYQAHAEEYQWPERTRVVSLSSRSDSLMDVAAGRLASGTSIEEVYAALAADTLNDVSMDTTMIADSTGAIYDRALDLSDGGFTGPHPFRGEFVVLVHDGIAAPRRKTFEEARSQIVSEYQKVLEERLVRRLRRRYRVRTYPERLVNAYGEETPQESASTASSQ